jgi:hypothetical protein
MNNFKFRIDGSITQNNLSGDNKIEVSAKISSPEKEAPTNKKAEEPFCLKKKWNALKKNKKVFGYWLIVVLLGVDICCHISYNCVIENINYIFAVIGVIATFIVVSNYAQVKEIRGEVDGKMDEVDEKMGEIETTLNDKINQMGNLMNPMAFMSMAVVFTKTKHYQESFNCSLSALEGLEDAEEMKEISRSCVDIVSNIIQKIQRENMSVKIEGVQKSKVIEVLYRIGTDKTSGIISFIQGL